MKKIYTHLRRTLGRSLAIAAAAIAGTLALSANEISESQAALIAKNFGNTGRTTMSTTPGREINPQLVETYQTVNGSPALYLFDRGDGFVIVSGNDNVREPVLGYGTTDFSYDEMPPAMKWWIDQYIKQVEIMSKAGEPPRRVQRYNDGLPAAVAPLLGFIAWDQGEPYNNDCPMDGSKRTYTGCVATSTAQIMKYYSWPAQGEGSWSYVWHGANTTETLSVDYSQQKYNWDLMPEHYTSANTAEENAEVAHLMYDVGVALSMDYGTSGSGASSTATVSALLQNFDYDSGAQFCYRSLYGIELWEETLRRELAAGRPVIYAGQSNEGGHQFVCDGYDENGYFHINWGWSGMCNGYFLTTALVPQGVGIGGFAAGYDYNQSMIIGIQPNQGHDNSWNPSYFGEEFYTNDGITYNLYAFALTFLSGTMNCDLGLAFRTDDTPVLNSSDVIYSANSIAYKANPILRSSSGLRQTTVYDGTLTCDPVNTLNLPDGTYYVFPLVKPQSSNEWKILPVADAQSIQVNIVDGAISLPGTQQGQVSLLSVNVPSVIPVNKPVTISGTLQATGDEFYSTVNFYIFNASGTVAASAGSQLVDIPAGDTLDFSVTLSTGVSFTPGNYTAQMVVAGQKIGPVMNVSVQSQAVELTSENFPDEAFLDVVKEAFDTDNDGVLSDAELAAATTLNATNRSITDVTGLEHFYAMHTLFLDGNELTEIDLSQLPNLAVLGLNNNRLTSLDVSNNTALNYLRITNNHIHTVDVYNCTMLKTLLVTGNPMLALDLTNSESLRTFESGSSENVTLDSCCHFSLANIEDMDFSHIKNLKGATISGDTLTFQDPKVTYDYDTGNPEFAAMPVTLTTNSPTGVSITKVEDGTKVITADGNIIVTGDTAVTVTDLAGRTIYTGEATTIPVGTGIYLVSTGSSVTKVAVK